MVVLKGVPALLSPELLFALARMGHGDEIGVAPRRSAPTAAVMELEPSDWERGLQTPVWRSYESILFMAGCTTRTHSHREVGLPQAHTCSRALRPGAAPHPQPLHPTFWSDPTLQAPAAHVDLPASGVCPGCCTGTHMHLSGGQSSCARGSLRARPHVSLSQSCGGWWYHHLG
ncbi:fucose mutarotase isoform X4 [Equus asinus]|uniref:fucose mutarotase isoform X4 n=1 Tax=Equus asinus TaxID=9793 RepID=UPI0038F6C046